MLIIIWLFLIDGCKAKFYGGEHMENSARNFVRIITEICEEENIELESYSYDWIFRLHKDGVYNYIMGYQFGLNSASVNSICCDKSAASEIMTFLGIPNVEHYFFMSPLNQKYVSKHGNWENIMKLLEKYGKLVCKSNEGTGGNLVFRVSNQYELESAVFNIFKRTRSMAISPYYDIENEYRIIVLNGEIKLAYIKQRPYVVGDGIHTVNQLLFEYVANHENSVNLNEIDPNDYNKILNNGEVYHLNWKHNLGQGAYAHIEDINLIKEKMNEIIFLLVNKMNIKFASIDIVKCQEIYKVLEINSGVMMEHFSQQDENTYNIAKSIYKEAILSMLN